MFLWKVLTKRNTIKVENIFNNIFLVNRTCDGKIFNSIIFESYVRSLSVSIEVIDAMKLYWLWLTCFVISTIIVKTIDKSRGKMFVHWYDKTVFLEVLLEEDQDEVI